MTESELVPVYWHYYALSRSDARSERLSADRLFWAWEQVDQAAINGDLGVVELLVELAEAAPDDAARAYLGAGPVEELVRLHGATLGGEIETAARRSEGFATALRSAW